MKQQISVREMQTNDIPALINYWTSCDREYLLSLGADIDKMPSPAEFDQILSSQISLPYTQKKSYALIWEVNGIPSGHTNVNNIKYGQHAFMHLHLWNIDQRLKGVGSQLVQRSLPYFFNKLQLTELFVEPYALNEAPNKTLKKVGFTFIKKYTTIPGSLNFEQEVNQWKMTREEFEVSIENKKNDPN